MWQYVNYYIKQYVHESFTQPELIEKEMSWETY